MGMLLSSNATYDASFWMALGISFGYCTFSFYKSIFKVKMDLKKQWIRTYFVMLSQKSKVSSGS